MSEAEEKSTPRSKRSSKDDKDDMELQMQDINSEEKGAPPKRTSGWGDTSHGDTKSSANTEDVEPTETKRGRRRKDDKAEPSKPKNKHFDDEGEATVAEAPRNTTRVVQTLKELERDVKYSLPTTAGVDLQILTSFLCPQRAVLEEDEPWDFDSLLRDVFQDIQKELEEKDNQEEADQASTPVKAP